MGLKESKFFTALDTLMEKYDVADYAVVARGVDGEMRSNWIAGTGESVISDRERGMVLYGEMALLQHSILNRITGFAPQGPKRGEDE